MNHVLPDLRELAEALCDTVRRAGDKVMEVYATDFSVDRKDDQSPVTEADQAAEAVILADLARLTPDVPVVAEESVSEGRVPDVGDGPFWLVDPLDGTKEFIKRNGEFTVNIGLVDRRRPVLGIVYAPAIDALYGGCGRGTAFRERDGRRQSIACRRPADDGLVVLSSRSHANNEDLAAYLHGKAVKEIVNAGSSLKFCRVAEGAADIYPRFGPTSEWDTCAAHAVLLAAGGDVVTPEGAPFLYGKPRFLNGHFIARCGSL